jgi:hypothetical protein
METPLDMLEYKLKQEDMTKTCSSNVDEVCFACVYSFRFNQRMNFRLND